MIGRLGSRALATLVALAITGTLLGGTPAQAADPTPPPEVPAWAAPPTPPDNQARRGGDATRDYPAFPPQCLGPDQIIPHTPGLCRLVRAGRGRPVVVLWGDSHAWQHTPALRALARKRNLNLMAFVFGSCPPFKMGWRADHEYVTPCERSNALALRYVTKRQRGRADLRVVLGGHWFGNFHAYQHPNRYPDYVDRIAGLFYRKATGLFRTLGRRGIDTQVIGQAATVRRPVPDCPVRYPFACDLPRRQALPAESKIRGWLRRQMRALPGRPRLVEVNERFCNARICRGRKNGIYTFYDDAHLSATRTLTLRREFGPTTRFR